MRLWRNLEDLKFQETSDRTNFQGRYIIQHPYTGEITCDAAATYQTDVEQRQELEAQNLASLTGWDIKDIRSKITFVQPKSWWQNIRNVQPKSWWQNIWN